MGGMLLGAMCALGSGPCVLACPHACVGWFGFYLLWKEHFPGECCSGEGAPRKNWGSSSSVQFRAVMAEPPRRAASRNSRDSLGSSFSRVSKSIPKQTVPQH